MPATLFQSSTSTPWGRRSLALKVTPSQPDPRALKNFLSPLPRLTQLDALRFNDTPHRDAGLELLYAFSAFDPWDLRAMYFGRSMDLG